jgi:hypothetical protein
MKGKSKNYGQKFINDTENKFRALLRNTYLIDFNNMTNADYRSITFMARSYGRNNALLRSNSTILNDLAKTLQEKYPNISEETIEKLAGRQIVQLFEEIAISEDADPELDIPLGGAFENLSISKEAIINHVKNLLNTLDLSIQKYTIYIPVEGIQLQGISDLRIGNLVTIYPTENGLIPKLIADYPSEYNVGIIAKTLGTVKCYGVIADIEGDIEFAKEEAHRKMRDAISILDFYLVLGSHRNHSWQKIGVIGQHANQRKQEIFYSKVPNPEKEEFLLPGISSQYLNGREYVINEAEVNKWKAYGYEDLVQFFEDGTKNDIALRVRRAITWYSKAMKADEVDEQFVALAVSLEILVGEKAENNVETSWGSIGQKLAERTAYLIGKNYQSKIDIVKRVKKLYGFRSGIVHSGIPISHENLHSLNNIVHSVILSFLARFKNFTNWEEFQTWESKQKFDG